MSPGLIFSDLFVFEEVSVTWLRVFLITDGEAVVLSIEPTDNPGRSTVNAAEALVDRVAQAFPEVASFRLLLAFAGPEFDFGSRWCEVVTANAEIEFEHCSTREVEALVGLGNAIPDDLGETCADLGGTGHPLLALVPAPDPERDPLDELAVVAVVDLPWPHNPSNCEWAARFEEIEEIFGVSGQNTPAVGAQWHLSLSPSDCQACRYHDGDWLRVAEVAVQLLEGRDPGEDEDALLERGYRLLEAEQDRHWLRSLFAHPISWAPGEPSITNGQHRSCALRASGAPFCIADAHGRFVPSPQARNPTSRAAVDVASYWASRAAD